MRSMTAFGEAFFADESLHLTISISSVNHRFFECSISGDENSKLLETEIKKVVKNRLKRGRVYVRMEFKMENESLCFDEKAFLKLLEVVKRAEKLSGKTTSLDFILKGEGVLQKTDREQENIENRVSLVLDEALKRFIDSAEKEGESMKEFFTSSLLKISSAIAIITKRNPAYREKIVQGTKNNLQKVAKNLFSKEQITQTLINANNDIKKSDITEEIERLNFHTESFRKLIYSKELTIGKHLNFILVEMQREINTIGAKYSETTVAQEIIRVKLEVERCREISQNLV